MQCSQDSTPTRTSTTTNKYFVVMVQVKERRLKYYSDLPVEVSDHVVIQTRYGNIGAIVVEVLGCDYDNPFEDGIAKCLVLENLTTKQINKECEIMSTARIVTVKHESGRTSVVHTDLPLKINDVVVYDSPNGMHVGKVIEDNGDVAAVTNNSFWVVDFVDLAEFNHRRERIAMAVKVRKQLDVKLKQFNELKMLEIMAANDSEAATLLGQYKELTGGLNYVPEINNKSKQG